MIIWRPVIMRDSSLVALAPCPSACGAWTEGRGLSTRVAMLCSSPNPCGGPQNVDLDMTLEMFYVEVRELPPRHATRRTAASCACALASTASLLLGKQGITSMHGYNTNWSYFHPFQRKKNMPPGRSRQTTAVYDVLLDRAGMFASLCLQARAEVINNPPTPFPNPTLIFRLDLVHYTFFKPGQNWPQVVSLYTSVEASCNSATSHCLCKKITVLQVICCSLWVPFSPFPFPAFRIWSNIDCEKKSEWELTPFWNPVRRRHETGRCLYLEKVTSVAICEECSPDVAL